MTVTTTWDHLASVIEFVGPHGYIHNWIFVGIPAAGQEVYHPQHGHGVVAASGGGRVQVSFDAGHSKTFPVRGGKGPGHFEQMTDDELAAEYNRSEGSRAKAIVSELDRRDQRDADAKAQRIKALYAEQPKSEADRNRVYQGLVNEGEDPEEAWSHAYSANADAIQKQSVIADLRSQGYKGSGFDALTRDAFKDEVRRRTISAEGATNGYMLSPAGKKAGIDPWSLFTGPESRARKYASPELKEWWDQNGRPTVTDFQAQLMGRKAGMKPADFYASVTWDDLDAVIELAVRAPVRPAGPQAVKSPPPAPSRRSRQVPLTPMRQAAAKSMRKLAAHVQESHPDMSVHDHLRDAARTLESGNEEASQRHLRAAMFALTPQSLMRNGLHTDDHHQGARQVMHGVHRHMLLVKDIADVGVKNREAIARLGTEDDTAPRPADPNAGYGPGANAQKPTARQPPGNQALNAPNRGSSGGSDPNVADPDGPQPRGSKQFAYGWGDLARVIEMTASPEVVNLVGPKGYVHGWIYVGGAGLPSVASHNAKLRAKGVTPPTKAHPALTSKPPSVKANTASPAKGAPKTLTAKPAAPAKASPKPPASPSPARGAAAAKSTPASSMAAVKPSRPVSKPDPNAERLVNQLNLMASFGGKSAQMATAKNISTSDLHAVDAEYRRQDLEKGRVAAGHKIVQGELANRGETALPVPTADELAKGKAAAKAEAARPRTPEEERQDLIGAWSTSYRYRGTTESKNARTKAFATEMHRLLSTNRQPKTCGPGCQDAHKFLTLVDKESVPQDKELTRGVALSNSAAERMFRPGKTVDIPVASWTNDDHTAANYARPSKDGQLKVVLHAAPGAKGLDITKDSNWENENEVVSGGRFNVDKVQTQDGVMHVYLTQGDFSAH